MSEEREKAPASCRDCEAPLEPREWRDLAHEAGLDVGLCNECALAECDAKIREMVRKAGLDLDIDRLILEADVDAILRAAASCGRSTV